VKQLAFDFYAKKVCSSCGQEKPLNEFTPSQDRPDGFRSKCKKCRNAYNRQRYAESLEFRMAIAGYNRRFYIKNRKRSLAKGKEWDKDNPEKRRAISRKYFAANREKEIARNRKYYAANPEKRRASSRKWRAANPDKVRAQTRKYNAVYPKKRRASSRKWRAANPDKVRAQTRLRRARKLEAPGNLTVEEEQHLYELYDHCLCCGTTEDLTVDHIVPLVEGGANSFENCQILCRPCNSRKGTQTIDYR